MRFLPVFFDVAAGTVALVGSGAAAHNKLRLLRAAGARIRWYTGATVAAAETAADDWIALAAADGGTTSVAIVAHDPMQLDFSDCIAVVSAAGKPYDEAVAARARAANIPVNVVDRPDLSTFIFPAVVDRGDVVVAIGTGGASPVLARRLRERIEALLPARIGDLAALLGRYRGHFARARPASLSLRDFWERVVDGPIGAAALAGRLREAEAALVQAIAGVSRQGMSSGTVYLVGTGPGDPDLLTLRALQVLQNADVIVHDEEVSAGVLDRARREAERIRVGGALAPSKSDEDAISGLLIEHARAGRTVVRLMSTDACAAERSAEQLSRLRQAGLTVAAVPGVTAAVDLVDHPEAIREAAA